MKITKSIINFIKKYIKIIVNFIKNVFDKKKAFLLLGIVSLLGVIFVISSSFAAEVEVTSITFTSNDLTYDTDAGSWRVRVNASMNAKKRGKLDLLILSHLKRLSMIKQLIWFCCWMIHAKAVVGLPEFFIGLIFRAIWL